MKWFRNKEMLEDILESNKKELQKRNSTKVEALLKDETNLIQDHLELMAENQELKARCKAIPPLVIQTQKLTKVIKDYCYIDNFKEGEIIRMCCESYEESNSEDFEFIKYIMEQ